MDFQYIIDALVVAALIGGSAGIYKILVTLTRHDEYWEQHKDDMVEMKRDLRDHTKRLTVLESLASILQDRMERK